MVSVELFWIKQSLRYERAENRFEIFGCRWKCCKCRGQPKRLWLYILEDTPFKDKPLVLIVLQHSRTAYEGRLAQELFDFGFDSQRIQQLEADAHRDDSLDLIITEPGKVISLYCQGDVVGGMKARLTMGVNIPLSSDSLHKKLMNIILLPRKLLLLRYFLTWLTETGTKQTYSCINSGRHIRIRINLIQ